MNIGRYLLSNIPHSPDDAVVDPPVGDDPPAPPVAAGDPPPDPDIEPTAPEAAVPPAPAKTPWFMTRLAEEGEKVRIERAAREQVERELAALKAKLEAGPEAAPSVPARLTRQPGQSDQDFETAVRREVDGRQLYAETSLIMQRGGEKFPDWGQTLATVQALKLTEDDVVLDILAADKENAHIIFDQLAKNPEKAVDLTRMPSRQRLAELVRMSTAIAPKAPAAPAPAAPIISKAPKPAPSLAPVSDGGGDDPLVSDAGTDEEFSAAWDRKFKGSRAVA